MKKVITAAKWAVLMLGYMALAVGMVIAVAMS